MVVFSWRHLSWLESPVMMEFSRPSSSTFYFQTIIIVSNHHLHHHNHHNSVSNHRHCFKSSCRHHRCLQQHLHLWLESTVMMEFSRPSPSTFYIQTIITVFQITITVSNHHVAIIIIDAWSSSTVTTYLWSRMGWGSTSGVREQECQRGESSSLSAW